MDSCRLQKPTLEERLRRDPTMAQRIDEHLADIRLQERLIDASLDDSPHHHLVDHVCLHSGECPGDCGAQLAVSGDNVVGNNERLRVPPIIP
jgi:hypothetical protein